MTIRDFGNAFKNIIINNSTMNENRNFLTTENINKSDKLYFEKNNALEEISGKFYSIPSISRNQKNLSLILKDFYQSL